ncbi:MAG: 50S ribosome-binding GTPase [Magnetococcales bacterium]|nr:50S ribosome-binding GTPase [Magnetococcales bacterium]
MDAIFQELDAFRGRHRTETVKIALFGDINTGKSSLIKAFLPHARVRTSVIADTDHQIRHYLWKTPQGDEVFLVDLPGMHAAAEAPNHLAKLEALLADIVLYVCTEDLTRDQYRDLNTLIISQKPIIIVLNKKDHHSQDNIGRIQSRITKRLVEQFEALSSMPTAEIPVIAVSSGGMREKIRRMPDGTEQIERETITPEVAPLYAALDGFLAQVKQQRNETPTHQIFSQETRQMADLLARYRLDSCEKLIQTAIRQAIHGTTTTSHKHDISTAVRGNLGHALTRQLKTIFEIDQESNQITEILQSVSLFLQEQASVLSQLIRDTAPSSHNKQQPLSDSSVDQLLPGVAVAFLGQAIVEILQQQDSLSTDIVTEHISQSIHGEDHAIVHTVIHLIHTINE